ncbi:DUF2057 family protein [Rouxiella chamberiensis]|uniref:DUF2057 family protein n=1 Tax=Rouxiella chamberiensis TaxID=1513468 RepID=A0ABY7HL55_9GAMM|nr:DUF2057 family protein [Rouxiella chamberiensis]WAS99665.1 DUF2057 family protein [Rouxiella chamberiensis]
MNLGLLFAGVLMASAIAPAYALSLKLSPEIDLLVVDGRQVSGPILKGADSLELDAGQHQLLFQITKNLPAGTSSPEAYHSPPIIVAFTAQNTHAVSIGLPTLSTRQEGLEFSKKMNISLVDEKGNPVSYRQDWLSEIKVSKPQNFEAAMTQYNLSGQPASIPAFAMTRKNTQLSHAENSGTPHASLADDTTASLSLSLWSILQQKPATPREAPEIIAQ